MSKTLIVGARRPGEHRWPVIVRDAGVGLLRGGLSVGSYTELMAMALQMSAAVECPRLVLREMVGADVGPKPMFSEDDEAVMPPRTAGGMA